jgi:exodeoxyribonuclease VII large subunit
VSTLFDQPFEDDPLDPSEDQQAASASHPRRTIFTVSELNARISELLETSLSDVWVEGEISNCKVWNNGHLYFTLKDAVGQLRSVMFRGTLRYLRFKPEDGLRVIARGRVGIYTPRGEYQLVCEHLEPHGLGALQLAFEQLKRRLQAEGLFDAARKRPLPELPRKIGIVTSLEGAALRDILNILRRRHKTAHLVICPTRVQGDGAAAEIAQAMRDIARVPGVDVVIVGRGGGSIEDLWAFNQEPVARAIGHSPVPVISAVGHESDITIADLVADLRAPTPSAAAELVVARKDDFYGRIDRQRDRAESWLRRLLLARRAHLFELTRKPAIAGWPARLAMAGRHTGELSHEMRRLVQESLAARERRLRIAQLQLEQFDLHRRLGSVRTRLTSARSALRSAIIDRYHMAQGKLGRSGARLEAMSPLAVLSRGYSVCRTLDGNVILRNAAAVSEGERVRVTLHRGELDCRVDRVDLADGRASSATRSPDTSKER